MIKLDVPFYKQTTSLNCGVVALQMVLAHFGEEVYVKVLEERCNVKDGKGSSTIQIAIASALSGFRTKLISKSLNFDDENLKLDFYRKYYDESLKVDRLVEKAKELGVKMEKKRIDLYELLGFVNKKSVPIVLLDWNVVMDRKEKGYQGHFVVVVGYDEENIIIHNHGMVNTKEFMSVKKEVFDEARKAQGTDEDVLVVYGKFK